MLADFVWWRCKSKPLWMSVTKSLHCPHECCMRVESIAVDTMRGGLSLSAVSKQISHSVEQSVPSCPDPEMVPVISSYAYLPHEPSIHENMLLQQQLQKGQMWHKLC